jgi:hypothetical protein
MQTPGHAIMCAQKGISHMNDRAQHGRFSALALAPALGLAALAGMGSLAGCSSWSTYPQVETKAARVFSQPTREPVPTIMAAALNYTQREYTVGKELPINLPDGCNWEAYQRVFERVSGEPRPMLKAGEPAIAITEVRTRAWDAEVDLVYPRGDGLNQLVTIDLSRDVTKPWHVKSARLWQIRDVTLPDPTYVAPTAEQLIKEKVLVGPNGERATTTTNWPEGSTAPASTQPAK